MKFLSKIILFVGYTLVYASVANHGKFATEPWAGLFTDAYTNPSANQSPTPPSGGSSQSGGTISNDPNQALTRPSGRRRPSQTDLNSILQQTQAGMSGGTP